MDFAMPPVIITTATLMGETAAALMGVLKAGYDLHSLEMASVMPCATMLDADSMVGTVAAMMLALPDG